MNKKQNKIIICLFILFFVCFLFSLYNENFTGKNTHVEIIIARYNENLDWLNNDIFNNYNITVYNKGVNYAFPKNNNIKRIYNIDNVGRCDHTYLYHIVKNYDNLADITLFLPGSCDMPEKKERLIDIIHKIEETNDTVFFDEVDDLYEDYKDFYLDQWTSSSSENINLNTESSLTPSEHRPFGVWFKHHFQDLKVKILSFFGIFAIHKRHILQHPKSYYEKFVKELEVSSNPEVGHYFERAWGAVFHPIF